MQNDLSAGSALLYGGDDGYRLRQEAILGIGGVRMLRALGHARIRRFHLNEGHAALGTFERVARLVREGLSLDAAFETARQQIRRALRVATAVPPGPVHLDLPADETTRAVEVPTAEPPLRSTRRSVTSS